MSPVLPIVTGAVDDVPSKSAPSVCCSTPLAYSFVPVDSATMARWVQVFSGGAYAKIGIER